VLNAGKRIVRVPSFDAPRTSAHPIFGAYYGLARPTSLKILACFFKYNPHDYFV
jgi:hypothetical protein